MTDPPGCHSGSRHPGERHSHLPTSGWNIPPPRLPRPLRTSGTVWVPQGCWSRNLPPSALLFQAPGPAAGTVAQPVPRQLGSLPARHSPADARRSSSALQTPVWSPCYTAQPQHHGMERKPCSCLLGSPQGGKSRKGLKKRVSLWQRHPKLPLYSTGGKTAQHGGEPGSPRAVGNGCEGSKGHGVLVVFHYLLCCKLIPIPSTSSRLSLCLRL